MVKKLLVIGFLISSTLVVIAQDFSAKILFYPKEVVLGAPVTMVGEARNISVSSGDTLFSRS